MFEALAARGFQMLMLHHAQAILQHDMASAVLGRLLRDPTSQALLARKVLST